jgi:hypothetical protein
MLLILPRPHGTWWRETELFELTLWVRAITHPTAWSTTSFASLWRAESSTDWQKGTERWSSCNDMFRDILVSIVSKLRAWWCRIGLLSPTETNTFLFSTASRPALGPVRSLCSVYPRLSTFQGLLTLHIREAIPPTHPYFYDVVRN